MKRLIAATLLTVIALSAFAQDDVTKFLGIPVDGTKYEMIQKLKAKGYTYDSRTGILTGEFNGRDVKIHVITNNNKVSRICVEDSHGISETDIKIRFNTLCNQFGKNGKYIPLEAAVIEDSEDISYEMTVHSKRYQAAYIQIPSMAELQERMQTDLPSALSKYSAEQWQSPTEEMKIAMLSYMIDTYSNNSVWFMINEKYGLYQILLFYDNQNNEANGEDL